MGNGFRLEMHDANGIKIPDTVTADAADLAGSVNDLHAYIISTLKLTSAQSRLIEPGFKTLEKAIKAKTENWHELFLGVLEELRLKGVDLEQREMLLGRMGRDGRTLLFRRELGEQRLLATVRDEHRGSGFGIELVDHDRFKHYNDTYGHAVGDLVLSTTGRLFRQHREGDVGVRWGGDEYLRIVFNLLTDTQLGLIGGRDSELVDSFNWEGLDERFSGHLPHLSIGLVYCENPSKIEQERIRSADSGMELKQEEWFDASVSVPPGSSYDITRRLVAMADANMYKAKRQQQGPEQTNVRIINGELVEY